MRTFASSFAVLAAALTVGTLGSSAAQAGEAAEASATPGISRGDETESSEWLNWTEGNLARRAGVPGRWQGEVSLSTNSATPGGFGATPDAVVTGRLGLGYGLSAELAASRSAKGDYRPGVGLKWQALSRGPYKLAIMGLFRPEGFNEPEGEVELHVIGSAKFGRTEVNLNAVAGGDPDGKDRDLEGVLGAGYRLTKSLLVGAEGRSRFGLGTKQEAWGRQEHVGGAVVQWDISGFTISGLAGGGMFQPTAASDLQTGLYGLGRIGYRF